MKFISVIIMAVLVFAFLASTPALASSSITYQGQLQLDGQPFEGQRNMSFQLFDQLSGGEAIRHQCRIRT